MPFRPRPSRRHAVLRRLAAVRDESAALDADDRWASRMGQAAHELGPVFASFATYLGSRLDLLRAADCRALARASAVGRCSPPARIKQILDGELGGAAAIADLRP